MTAMADSDALGQKQRFGLFSQPISTAIGDDGPYKSKLRMKYKTQEEKKPDSPTFAFPEAYCNFHRDNNKNDKVHNRYQHKNNPP